MSRSHATFKLCVRSESQSSPWSLLKVRDSGSKMSVENIEEKPLGRGISRPACATSFPGFYPTQGSLSVLRIVCLSFK